MVTTLRCGNCGSDLHGLPTDLVFLCPSCGRCWVSSDRLSPMDVRVGPVGSGSIPMPFWEVEATVDLRRRVSRREAADAYVDGPRDFDGFERELVDITLDPFDSVLVFPAFVTSLVLTAGVGLSGRRIPASDATEPPKLVGGAVGPEDALLLAEGVAVGMEVADSDYLAFLDLSLQVRSLRLLVLGCTPGRHFLEVDGTEVSLPYTSMRDSTEILRAHGMGE